jgi:fatty-acyl-CoA synthase
MPITVSHVRGATSTPPIETTIGAAFDAATECLADHEALVVRHQNIRWTYTEFRRQVDELAAGLVALGLQPGERVGIWSTNNSETPATASGNSNMPSTKLSAPASSAPPHSGPATTSPCSAT